MLIVVMSDRKGGHPSSRPTPRDGSAPIPISRPLQSLGSSSRGTALSERPTNRSNGPREPSSIRSTWPCRRGVVIRGKVTEEGSGKPVAGARVSYRSGDARRLEPGPGLAAATRADGSFQLAVLPQAGLSHRPGPQRGLRAPGDRPADDPAGPAGRAPLYAHAFIARDLKPAATARKSTSHSAAVMTVKGQVVGPDGQPVRDAWMISRIILMPSRAMAFTGGDEYHGNVRNGRFEVHGLAPDAEVPVYFLDPKHKLGATVHLSGKSATGGPVTVRLQPCGTARARLVDPVGKPIAGYRDPYLIAMVVTPGPSRFSRDKADQVVWRPIKTTSAGSTRSTTRMVRCPTPRAAWCSPP